MFMPPLDLLMLVCRFDSQHSAILCGLYMFILSLSKLSRGSLAPKDRHVNLNGNSKLCPGMSLSVALLITC